MLTARFFLAGDLDLRLRFDLVGLLDLLRLLLLLRPFLFIPLDFLFEFFVGDLERLLVFPVSLLLTVVDLQTIQSGGQLLYFMIDVTTPFF